MVVSSMRQHVGTMSGLLDGLDPSQREAAEAVFGPVCIIAGAGTGKTRTVTHRLAYAVSTGQLHAERALAVTHSKKAAAELGERLSCLGVTGVDARTFHAGALRVAAQFWAVTGRPGESPVVLGERDSWRVWRDSLRSVTGKEPDNVTVREVTDEVAWARSRLVSPEDYQSASSSADRNPGVDPRTVTDAWQRYANRKAAIERVDFADLLEIAADVLHADPQAALRVRSRWAHVTVDEYQDTDPAQQRLLDAIVGDSQDVCVVGDPRQAIYSWKGADPGYLTDFPRRYPSARVINLERNYRSSPQILKWANRTAVDRTAKLLVATRPAGPSPKVHRLETESAEASWVAGATRRVLAAGTWPAQVAVLYRYNSAQARFEAAMTRAGIASRVAEDVTFFEREEIRSALARFGAFARAEPDRDGNELLSSVLGDAGFDPDSPPAGLGAARTRWESFQALAELVQGLSGGTGGGLSSDARSTLGEVNALARRNVDLGSDGVTLATLHRSKGLEWDVVFVVGMADGCVPSSFATTPAQLAEEERLLHVGITRARRELHLTWAAQNARGWDNRPSPYLEQLSAVSATPLPSPLAPSGRPSKRTRTRGRSPGAPSRPAAASVVLPAISSCAHCAEPLKGASSRRLGVCADCVRSAPGALGRIARQAIQVSLDAANATGNRPEKLLSGEGLLRLLDKRPSSAEEVAATLGVDLSGQWASRMVTVLDDS